MLKILAVALHPSTPAVRYHSTLIRGRIMQHRPIRSAAAAGKHLSRAILSASVQPQTWTSSHEQVLHNFLMRSTITPSLVSSTIDPYLVSHYSLAHGLFQWASQQPYYSHTPETYHSLLKSLAFSRQSHSVHSLLKQARAQNIALLASSYHLVISCLLSCNRAVDAAGLIWEVPVSRHDNSIINSCNSILAALVDNGRLDRAKKLFDEMLLRGVPCNDVGFGVFISEYCGNARLDEIFSMVEEVKRRGWEINGSIMALLIIDGLSLVGRAEEAWQALEGMRIRACKPDFMAYRIVADSFKTASRFEEAMMILKQKRKLGVAPTSAEYKEYIFALISEKRYMTANRVGKAIVDGDFPIDDELLNALISSVSSVEPSSAMDFCAYMLKKESFPDFAVLSSLSRNLNRHNKSDELWDICRVLLSKDYFRTPDHCNMIMSLLCDAGKVREAYDVLKDMRKKDVRPDVSSYNTLLEACCRGDLLRPAKKLWDEMFAHGCCPNLQTYNILIHKFSEINEPEEALRLYHHMLGKGLPPDKVTYTSLVKVLCRLKRIEEACMVFKNSMEQDAVLAGSILSELIFYLCQEGIYMCASRVLLSLPPNTNFSGAHVVLLKNLADAGQFDKAVDHITHVKHNSPAQLKTILNNLMESLSTAPKLEPFLQLLQEMSKNGLVSECGPWLDLLDGSFHSVNE